MKLVTKFVIVVFSILSVQCNGQSETKKVRFEIIVNDQDVKPLEDVNVELLYGHFEDDKSKSYKGLTNQLGKFTAEDEIIFSTVLWLDKKKYYSIRKDSLLSMVPEKNRQNVSHEITFTMRQIKSPIPLCGKVVNRAIPEQNKPIGYDLLIGDWVKPYGKGANGDYFVTFHKKHLGCKNGDTYEDIISRLTERHRITPRAKKEFLDSIREFYETDVDYNYQDAVQLSAGHWNGKIQITFPNKDEGITEVKDGFHSYSELTMPHEAPENGYQKDWSREEDNAGARLTSSEIGYFLRTRVKHDEKGKIVSANYAKIVTDFNFDPRGRLEFSYLFNPTPNDRNLEFDPKKNLFKNLEFREEIRKP